MPLSTTDSWRRSLSSSMRIDKLVLAEQFRIRERLETQFVSGVRRVRDQLAKEDFLVAVQGMDHQLEKLTHLGLEAEGLFLVGHAANLLPWDSHQRPLRWGSGVRFQDRSGNLAVKQNDEQHR